MDRPHRHQWQPADPVQPAGGFVCSDCPATTVACTGCGHPIDTGGPRVCPDCVSRTRNDLRSVRDLYRRLPDVIAQIAGLHATRYDRGGGTGKTRSTDTTIPGGAALVLAAGGYANKTRLGPHETTVDPSLIAAERHDPPSVLAVLTFWEDTLRAERGDQAAEATSIDAATTWLIEHVDWAAQRSLQWDDYRQDLRDLLWRLRRLTGDTVEDVETGVPCPYCAGRVVQRWTSNGLGEIRKCVGTKARPGCGLEWASEAHFLLAIRDAHESLPTTRPDQLVTLDDAKRIYRRRITAHLLDVWANQGSVPPARHEDGRPRRDVRGQVLYRLGTIDQQINTGKEDTA